jgi:rhamnose utilization protein RhaD (predicted bifunctional aldolase and dehydrogenase)
MTSNPVLAALERVSAELARDPLIIQGAGGNTSLKSDGILWIKASGSWLVDAEKKPIFVPLLLSKVLNNIFAEKADSLADARLPDRKTEALKPSIEAALHAVMPHVAVIHAHAVNCTTTALLADGRARFEQAMSQDLRGLYLPYATPGLRLANAVREAVKGNSPPDVVLLQNHGVVVGAECPDDAANLLREVERRLEFVPRSLSRPDRNSLSAFEGTPYRAFPAGSGMALDPYLFNLLTTSAFTPDQIVFLGGPVPAIRHDDDIELAARLIEKESGMAPALILQEGVGAFVRRDASPGTEVIIRWLLHIAERIPEGAEVLSLPTGEVANLFGWDAERYRMKLDRDRQAGS